MVYQPGEALPYLERAADIREDHVEKVWWEVHP